LAGKGLDDERRACGRALRAYLQERAADGAPAHEIMAQGRWKTARMVEVYTRAKEAGRAARWLAWGHSPITLTHSGAVVLVWLAVLWIVNACSM